MEQFPKIWGILQEIREENSCLSLKDLAVNGKDLMELGFVPGKAIGACLNHLLDLVLDEKVENQKDVLLEEARTFL